MRLKTGIDLVEIKRLEKLDPAIRARFLERVFTQAELSESKTAQSLAGRFAVKEAVAKALGCGIGAIGWKSIEIRRGSQGEPVLTLSGKALEMAIRLGLEEWSISISHTATHAIGLAVAAGKS